MALEALDPEKVEGGSSRFWVILRQVSLLLHFQVKMS